MILGLYFADLVAFDPGAIGASAVHRVYDQPGGADRLISRSTVVQHMWVNGVAVRADDADVPGVTAGPPARG
jgi:N-acyl-D-amino-acid deacylase